VHHLLKKNYGLFANPITYLTDQDTQRKIGIIMNATSSDFAAAAVSYLSRNDTVGLAIQDLTGEQEGLFT